MSGTNRGSNPFVGDGATRALGRQTDWSKTSLGPWRDWSHTLRGIVRTCLDSSFPINLWCGPERILIYNDAYSRILGNRHPEAFARPGAEAWSDIWPAIEPMFDHLMAGGPPIFDEDAPFTVRRDDDVASAAPNAWYTFSLSPVRDDDGAIVCFLNIVSDTTSRIMAERATEAALEKAEGAEVRLRDIFTFAPAFMAVVRGPNYVFEYVNDAYYKLVGHRELIGRPAAKAMPEVRGQGYFELLDKVVRTGTPYTGREMEVLVTPAEGEEPVLRYIDFVYYPLRDGDGSVDGILAHGYDVTEHVFARAEAHRARTEAEQANRAKSQFLANMSHEIRTPINAVMGYADLLDVRIAGPLTEKQIQFVDRIRESSRHLLALVDDVLDLSKVEAGEMLVRVERTALRPVMNIAMQLISPQAQARGLTLSKAYDCGDAPVVLGDEDRIRQILLNMLSNAVKFTPRDGRITMRCRTESTADPDAALPDVGSWIIVEVEDSGPGIPTEQRELIFEPFVQAEGGHTRRIGGTGLGLSISRRFARLMGGDLTVRSRLGEGSRFRLWLPAAVQPDGTAPSRGADNAQTIPIGRLGRILLRSTEQLERIFVDRLRVDHATRSARNVTLIDVADHTAATLAIIARGMMALAERTPSDPLVREGNAMQDAVASRHGRQRRRIAWGRDELVAEYRIMHEVVDQFLREAATSDGVDGDIDGAFTIAHRLIDRACGVALRAYDSV